MDNIFAKDDDVLTNSLHLSRSQDSFMNDDYNYRSNFEGRRNSDEDSDGSLDLESKNQDDKNMDINLREYEASDYESLGTSKEKHKTENSNMESNRPLTEFASSSNNTSINILKEKKKEAKTKRELEEEEREKMQ